MSRPCELCDQVDGHPRHTTGARPGTRPPLGHHLDCGASGGCVVCSTSMSAYGCRTREDLVDHLACLRTTEG